MAPLGSVRHLLEFDTWRLPHHLTDVLVVGAGVAGYRAALAASRAGCRVLLIAKGEQAASNTGRAQGGIAAVMGDEPADSDELHMQDTIAVGQGLCDPEVVRRVVEGGRAGIEDLVRMGASFDLDASDPAKPARGLEGGHSASRILHARGDSTGAEIRDTLAAAAEADAGIEIWAQAFMVDLLTDDTGTCRGALMRVRGRLRSVWAGAVVLAAGGYAQLYQESTNVAGATGDGLACAWRAGAEVQDIEFVQFHPTTLYLAGVPRLLITEAVRGEGAHIVDEHGVRFLESVDPRAELAPRDVISRAIHRHLERPDVQGVYLDLAHLSASRVAERFPGVVGSCKAHGLDIARDRIPIRPAAHYTIGGVRVDASGRSNVPGLFAAGEVSSTGLHGANRLASNSLLEGLVLGDEVGTVAAGVAKDRPASPLRIRGEGTGARAGSIDVDDLRVSLKTLLWREAGIERGGGNLAGAAGAVRGWEGFAQAIESAGPTRLVLLNMLCVARLLTESALLREESRGTHFRKDHDTRDDERFLGRIVHQIDQDTPRIDPLSVAESEASAQGQA